MIRQSRRKRKFDKEKERLIHTVSKIHGVMIQSYITNTLKSNVLNDTWCIVSRLMF